MIFSLLRTKVFSAAALNIPPLQRWTVRVLLLAKPPEKKIFLQKFIILNHFSVECSAIIPIAHNFAKKCPIHNFAKKSTRTVQVEQRTIFRQAPAFRLGIFYQPYFTTICNYLISHFFLKTYLDFVGINSGPQIRHKLQEIQNNALVCPNMALCSTFVLPAKLRTI